MCSRPGSAQLPLKACHSNVAGGAPSETSYGVDMKTPSPRKLRASKPCSPASNAACAAGPPSGYVSFCSGASDM